MPSLLVNLSRKVSGLLLLFFHFWLLFGNHDAQHLILGEHWNLQENKEAAIPIVQDACKPSGVIAKLSNVTCHLLTILP